MAAPSYPLAAPVRYWHQLSELEKNVIKRQNASRMRDNPTKAEKIMWSLLRNRRTGYKFYRQILTEGYILDFYCPECKLAVEVDGPYHQNNKHHDYRRDIHFKSIGILTLRFPNQRLKKDWFRVTEIIRSACRDRFTGDNDLRKHLVQIAIKNERKYKRWPNWAKRE